MSQKYRRKIKQLSKKLSHSKTRRQPINEEAPKTQASGITKPDRYCGEVMP